MPTQKCVNVCKHTGKTIRDFHCTYMSVLNDPIFMKFWRTKKNLRKPLHSICSMPFIKSSTSDNKNVIIKANLCKLGHVTKKWCFLDVALGPLQISFLNTENYILPIFAHPGDWWGKTEKWTEFIFCTWMF